MKSLGLPSGVVGLAFVAASGLLCSCGDGGGGANVLQTAGSGGAPLYPAGAGGSTPPPVAGVGGGAAGSVAPPVAGSTPVPAAGSMATPMGVPGCEIADASAGGPALHAAAADVLTMMSPCGFSSCHVGTGKAGLVLLGATNLNMLLVGKPSCEAPNVPLVDGAGGDAGLLHSYIWIKLTGAADSGGSIMGDPAWGTGGACGQTPSAPYGIRMPQMATNMTTSDTRLAAIRNWICAGAPAP